MTPTRFNGIGHGIGQAIAHGIAHGKALENATPLPLTPLLLSSPRGCGSACMEPCVGGPRECMAATAAEFGGGH